VIISEASTTMTSAPGATQRIQTHWLSAVFRVSKKAAASLWNGYSRLEAYQIQFDTSFGMDTEEIGELFTIMI
jgi:hypothetical protein